MQDPCVLEIAHCHPSPQTYLDTAFVTNDDPDVGLPVLCFFQAHLGHCINTLPARYSGIAQDPPIHSHFDQDRMFILFFALGRLSQEVKAVNITDDLLQCCFHFFQAAFYWMLMGGVIFYAPIMVDSFIYGTLEATRTVAIFGLWVIFSVGLTIGSKISRGA